MISKSKLAIIAAIVAMGIASPAFAKSVVHQGYNADGSYTTSGYDSDIITQR